jgi:toxin ParE1/3/4
MAVRVHWTREAEQDAIEIASFLGHDRRETAIRFLDAISATLDHLQALPRTGRALDTGRRELQGMRFKPVRRFRRYLLFYRILDAGILVVRVLHGSRDLPAILE